MIKRFVLTLSLSLLFIGLQAQHTQFFTHKNKLFSDGKDFFEQKKYSASYRYFELFLEKTELDNFGMRTEAEYYLANNAYQLRQKNATLLLTQYIKKHPYTPYYDEVMYMLGNIEYEKKEYQEALKYYAKVNEKKLSKEDKSNFLFSDGYTKLVLGKTKEARTVFKKLKTYNTAFLPTAKFYSAYCDYKLANYDKALTGFTEIEHHPKFNDIVPYYIAQIYFSKDNNKEFEKRANALLRRYPNSKNNGEIYRMLAEKEYRKGNYKQAIDYFERYKILFPKMLREDVYYLGVSYLKNNHINSAIEAFSKVTTKKDAMTEDAYLQLGKAYLAKGDKNNARMAFATALRTNFNKKVREEAMFNYALTTYESQLGFGESVKAFESFIKEYPKSQHINSAYDYLSEVYLTSKNYSEAYKSILKIKKYNSNLKRTKQYLEYNLGTEAFASQNYPKAIMYFTLAEKSAPKGKFMSDILFWRGETYYRLEDYQKSSDDLSRFFQTRRSRKNKNYVDALYNLGYAYFAQKEYDEALPWFLKYIEKAKNTESKKYIDAQNRIGDVYFYNRDLALANEYYQKTSENKSFGDYSLYQTAYMLGLQKNYNEKIEKLNSLIEQYPHSEYNDDAMYEIGRSYIMLNENQKAIETYNNLVVNYPQSQYIPTAKLEIGMIYFNEKNYSQATSEFKKVIENYPNNIEAKTAFETLEAISIETNSVDEHLAYSREIGQIDNLSDNKVDSIQFLSAEKKYMEGDYANSIEHLQNYLNKNCPNGKFCDRAKYYLADNYYQLDQKEEALKQFTQILSNPNSSYLEKSALKASQISFELKEYKTALHYFKMLQNSAQTTANKNIAQLGILRCSHFMGNKEEVKSIAEIILNNPNATDDMQAEALVSRANILVKENQPSLALKDLRKINIDTRTEFGAEAKYLLAKTYYNLNMLDKAQKEVLNYAQKGTPHKYWLAKSFIVLADVYRMQDDYFQAKQYLLNLQKNYTKKDDIQTMITKRLNIISAKEKQQIIQQ